MLIRDRCNWHACVTPFPQLLCLWFLLRCLRVRSLKLCTLMTSVELCRLIPVSLSDLNHFQDHKRVKFKQQKIFSPHFGLTVSQLSFSVLNTSAGVIPSMMRWFRRKTKANSEHAYNSFLRSVVHFLFVIYNLMIAEFFSDHRFISFQFQQETEEERSLEKMLESTGSYISLL